MAYGDPGAGGDLSDWGGGTSGGGGPDPWDPDPEDYRPRASRTPTDYEAEASASTLERFVPPSPPPRDQGVGSLLGDAGQRIKDYMSENWMPNRNLKNPWATALGAITEVPANILAAMFGVPADFQFFSNEDLLGTATQPPGVKFGIPGIVQAQLSGKGLEGIGSFFGNQPLSVDLGGTVKGTGGSDLPTQPGRFGYLGPSPFGPFDLGPRGKADLAPGGKADLSPWERTMNQGIAASKQRMLDQAARTIRQQPGSPDPLNRAPIATPLPTGKQVSTTLPSTQMERMAGGPPQERAIPSALGPITPKPMSKEEYDRRMAYGQSFLDDPNLLLGGASGKEAWEGWMTDLGKRRHPSVLGVIPSLDRKNEITQVSAPPKTPPSELSPEEFESQMEKAQFIIGHPDIPSGIKDAWERWMFPMVD